MGDRSLHACQVNTAPAAPSPHPAPLPCALGRWIAARKRYCRSVEAKLAQRAQLRLQARALQAWLEARDAALARQAQLRAAVRRMAHLKLFHAFAGGP